HGGGHYRVDDQIGSSRLCSAHVHFLLCRAVWGLTTDSALAFAAAAITGGNPYKTTMMAWKYTLPAFLVPFMFTLHPDGIGLLLKGSWGNIAWTTITAAVGLAALAGLTGWLLMKTTWFERGLVGGCRSGLGLSKSARGLDRADAFCSCGCAAVLAPALGHRP